VVGEGKKRGNSEKREAAVVKRWQIIRKGKAKAETFSRGGKTARKKNKTEDGPVLHLGPWNDQQQEDAWSDRQSPHLHHVQAPEISIKNKRE